jgi:hypothetical protein
MNDMRYPNGRWTPKEDSIRGAVKTQRIPLFAQPAASLLKTPLRELFWGLPESNLLEEARQRVESVMAIALAKDEPAVFQTELGLA